MDVFLHGIASFPTVIFTVMLGVVLIYWLFVVLGAFDVDFFGGGDGFAEGAAEGAAEGLAEGAAEGLAEGAAEGLAEGAAEGLADGAAEGMAEGASEGLTEGASEGATDAVGGSHASAGIFSALKLRSAPVTVVVSVLVLTGWVISYLSMRMFGPSTDGLGHWLIGLGVFVVAIVVGLLITSVVVRPLAPLFKTHTAGSRLDLIGKVCVVRTGKVTARFGQARLSEGGTEHLIDVRCDEANRLRKGKRALIIDFDDDREAFVVEPLDPMLALPAEAGDERSA